VKNCGLLGSELRVSGRPEFWLERRFEICSVRKLGVYEGRPEFWLERRFEICSVRKLGVYEELTI